MKKPNQIKVGFLIDRGYYQALQIMCRFHNTNVSDVIRSGLDEWIRDHEETLIRFQLEGRFAHLIVKRGLENLKTPEEQKAFEEMKAKLEKEHNKKFYPVGLTEEEKREYDKNRETE